MATRRTRRSGHGVVRLGPSSDDGHAVVYFKRHPDDDPCERVPGRAFMREVCPPKTRIFFDVVLAQVAAAPPKRFAGGGYWEAMKGDMTGWFEVRKDGPGRKRHYRLFCLLDYQALGQDKPLLVVIDGRDKAVGTELSASDYAAVRQFGEEYLRRNPRSLHG